MAVDFFLKLDGITGESQDVNHKDEIQVLSWSWGASQTTSVAASGGSGAGKASLSELNIMTNYDASTGPLFNALLKGVHIKTGMLTANKSAGEASGKAFLQIDLTELFVTSVQTSGSSEIPSVSVSFSYNTVKITYSKQDEKGNLVKTKVVSYDLKTNKVAE